MNESDKARQKWGHGKMARKKLEKWKNKRKQRSGQKLLKTAPFCE